MSRSPLILSLLTIVAAVSLQAAVFTGTVRNTNGQVLGNMTVQAYNAAGFPVSTSTTSSQGGYQLIVPAGTYRILAYDNSGTYAVNFYTRSNLGGAPSFELSDAINVTDIQVVEANFALPLGFRISGFVVDAGAGGAMNGAVVAAYNLDGTRRTHVKTGSDGSFALTVPAGSYKIVSYHEVAAYIPMFFQNERLFERATVVSAPASNISIGLFPGVKLIGFIREKVTGQPIGDATVVAYDLQGNPQYRTSSNSAGEFALVVASGVYKIAAEDPTGVYQTTFYRDATTFASAASISVDGSAPLLQFSVGRIPNAESVVTLFIPGIIHNLNAVSGTFFKTDVWIQNPGDAPIAVTATFLPAGQDNSAATGVPLDIGARGQIHLEDLVQSLFGSAGAGALRLESNSRFRATSRTYNVPPNAAEIGTFGLSIPAQPIGGSLGRATLAGLVQNSSSRTNIGLMNPQPFPVNVKIDVFSETGALLGSGNVSLNPFDWAQPSVRGFVAANFDQAYAIVSSEEGSFFSYAAVVDAKSADGTFILPSED